MKKRFAYFLLLSIIYCNLWAVDIVPLPYHVKHTGDVFVLSKNIDYEKKLMEEKLPGIPSFHINIVDRNRKQDFGEEGYELLISKVKIVLSAHTERGLFYGKQSLIQLIRASRNNRLPGLHIIDRPACKYRGVMDDISRGPVPSKEYMKYQIRRMAELKLNMLCYYTEHIVQTQKHPGFAPPHGGITIEEWKEIGDYAEAHYIELVPNFQSLGHAEKVLLNPKYRHLAESNGMYSPVNPETVLFLKDIYDEMCPAFASDFFHVNCDETFDLGRGPSKSLADSIGIARLYAGYMNTLAGLLRNNRKRMMMWGDIALQHPETLSLLPSDAVMMTWEYGDQPSFAKWIEPFAGKGFDFMVCPGVLNSLRLFPNYDQALANIRNFVREGVEKGAMGVLNTVWDDGGLHTFDRDWYGVAYGAEQSWNPNTEPVEDFDVRLSAGIYGGEGEALFAAIHKLTEMGEIPAIDNMNELIFWKTIIPERGKFVRYGLSDWETLYETCLEVDSILNRKSAGPYQREYEAFRIVSDEYKYLSQAKLKMAEAAALYAGSCCIQFENKDEARNLLANAEENIRYCRLKFSELKNAFDTIWKRENRDYWHDYAMDPFEKVLNEYDDVIRSFEKSFRYFEQGFPLAAPADIRLDIRPMNEVYFTYWLISPAFPLENTQDAGFDFLQGMGGERTASPFPGFSFDHKGKNIKWIKYASPLSDKVSLNTVLDTGKKAIAYAFCTLESSGEQTVVANIGTSKGITVFLNGSLVFQERNNTHLLVDEFQCPLKLIPGKNRILLKIEKTPDEWEFSFSLKGLRVLNSKNRYRII
ncbi:MAG: beta-N-acetylhexosaminidase [Dysgonamonadaceae bacterium]|jgi:hypothetical protein|nr:beta-N-acetylhexosaminidase [Dysgonamonadaceae bacterium]